MLTFWFIAVTLITAAYAGAMANVVDIAPNFAGVYGGFFGISRRVIDVICFSRAGPCFCTDNSHDC